MRVDPISLCGGASWRTSCEGRRKSIAESDVAQPDAVLPRLQLLSPTSAITEAFCLESRLSENASRSSRSVSPFLRALAFRSSLRPPQAWPPGPRLGDYRSSAPAPRTRKLSQQPLAEQSWPSIRKAGSHDGSLNIESLAACARPASRRWSLRTHQAGILLSTTHPSNSGAAFEF